MPLEMIIEVMNHLDLKTLLECQLCNRLLYEVLDPKSKCGSKIWKTARINDGWPDPTVIYLTDYEFARAHYNKNGCSYCPEYPNLKKIHWQWRGIRMCPSCLQSKTVNVSSDYQYDFPYLEVEYYNRTRRLYLKDDFTGKSKKQAVFNEHEYSLWLKSFKYNEMLQ